MKMPEVRKEIIRHSSTVSVFPLRYLKDREKEYSRSKKTVVKRRGKSKLILSKVYLLRAPFTDRGTGLPTSGKWTNNSWPGE